MPRRQAAFGEVFDLFSTCRDRHGRIGRRDSGGAVCMTGSAIEIKAAVGNDYVFTAVHHLLMAVLMVRSLRPLRGRSVAAAAYSRCSRKLQRQQ